MDTSLIVAASAIGGNVLIGIGLAYTWKRNGAAASAKYGALQETVKNVGDDVTALTATVTRVGLSMDKAAVEIGRHDERLHSAERDIGELKKK